MIKSPIQWSGGKARMMPELLKHLSKANCLIKPFVGGDCCVGCGVVMGQSTCNAMAKARAF